MRKNICFGEIIRMSRFYLFSVLILLFLCQFSVSAQNKILLELPMKFRGTMPAVEVMVNGEGPFLFAIDTGAQGMARADSSLVKRLGLKTNGQIQAGDGSGRNVRTLETVEIDSIAVSDLKFEKVTALTRDYNTSPNLPKIDGILGFNLFADYLLTLDYPAQKVRIERGELPTVNGQDILDFDDSRHIPIVELQVGSQKIKAHIDSGNVGGFMLATSIVEKSALASEPQIVGRAGTVSNEIEIKQVRLKDSIKLGNFEFTEPPVNFPALSDANIGSRVLSEFAITFDRKNKRLKLARTIKTAGETAFAKTENTSEYIGSYGDRTISEENGNLFIQRPNGMKLKLVQISKDEFTLERIPTAKLKFSRDANGKISEIQVLNQAGVWEKAAKNL